MANVILDDTKIKSIADAVREKTFTTDTMKVDEMPDLIRSIQGFPDIELFHTYENVINLSRDTTWDSVTPNTSTAQTIRPAGTNNEIDIYLPEVIDREEYDILAISENVADLVYKTGNIIPRVLTNKTCNATLFRWSNRYNNEALTEEIYYNTSLPSVSQTVAYNLSNTGVFSLQTSNTYLAPLLSALTLTLWTSESPSGGAPGSSANRKYACRFTNNPPLISIRASTTVNSVEACKDIDSEKTNIYRRFYFFKIPHKAKTIFTSFIDVAYLYKPIETMFE